MIVKKKHTPNPFPQGVFILVDYLIYDSVAFNTIKQATFLLVVKKCMSLFENIEIYKGRTKFLLALFNSLLFNEFSFIF